MFFIVPATSSSIPTTLADGMYTRVNVLHLMFLITATSAHTISAAVIAATSASTTSADGMYTHVNVALDLMFLVAPTSANTTPTMTTSTASMCMCQDTLLTPFSLNPFFSSF